MYRLILTRLLLAALLCASVQIQAEPGGGSKPNGPAASRLPLGANSVRFAVIGDSGSGDRAEYEIAEQLNRIQRATNFNFVIMLGDNLLNGNNSPNDYETKFNRPYRPLLDNGVKFYASLGNHDNPNERAYAPFNMNGRRYYTFMQGEVEFFVLDSTYMDRVQLEWLRAELEKSTAPWKIAYFHHPIYSSARRHGSDTDLRTVLEPFFLKYGINVVLGGHDHVYERIVPQHGILYFVMGSSGALRSGDLANDSLKGAGFDSNQCFLVVEIAGDALYYQAISRSGQTVDSGVFKRPTPGNNRSATPEEAKYGSASRTK
jgi:predicted phosphodiesterase